MSKPSGTWLDTTVRRMAASPWFSKVAPRFVPQFDRFLQRVTRGRVTLSGRAVPSVLLHAVGAKSGLSRDTPLAALPDDDGAFYVVGSNYGRESHPVWTSNLLARPDVALTHRGTRTDVRARLLDADEKAAIWPRLVEMWPVYDTYTERSGRDLRVFKLEPR